MKLRQLAGEEIDFAVRGGESDADPEITGIAADSRDVRPGYLFVAVKGGADDGARYIADAVAAGAAALLTHRQADISSFDLPVGRLTDPRQALARIASRYYPRQPSVIAAVTGTAGKTSVTAFLRQIWQRSGVAAASIGTTGVVSPTGEEYGNLTTPDPVALHRLLDRLAGEGVDHAAMEASSHGLDQFRLDSVRLTAGAFTNLGRDHMDYHPTVAHYFAAKMRLFTELLPKGAPAVIFADDAWSDRAAETARESDLDVLTVGRKGQFLALKRVEHERFRQIAEIQHHSERFRIEFPLAGDFQIANALVAAGLAVATGADPRQAIEALPHISGAPGRLDLVGHTPEGAPCYVDYAHKPDALEHVLTSLRPFTTGKLVCVFGCGGDRDPGKRPIMGEIATRLADRVIVTDDNPRSEDPAAIRQAILEAAPGAEEIGDRRQAIETAVALLGRGDCLVVAGKGHETGQTTGTRTVPFSDHAVLREAIADGVGA